jgi:pantothenate synthetase
LGKSCLVYNTLRFVKDNSPKFGILELKKKAIQKFNKQSALDLEYLEIVSLANLNPIDKLLEKDKNAVCIAASISGVRLIDNIIF